MQSLSAAPSVITASDWFSAAEGVSQETRDRNAGCKIQKCARGKCVCMCGNPLVSRSARGRKGKRGCSRAVGSTWQMHCCIRPQDPGDQCRRQMTGLPRGVSTTRAPLRDSRGRSDARQTEGQAGSGSPSTRRVPPLHVTESPRSPAGPRGVVSVPPQREVLHHFLQRRTPPQPQ